MPQITVNGVKMFYKIEGEGEPVVLIHGLGGDHTLFDGPLKSLFLERHKVIAMDLRGHGRSSRTASNYSVELFAQDVKSLMLKLKIDSATVIGISMGGAVAMTLAGDTPSMVRKLVLIDTWAKCDAAARACFMEWIEASKESLRALQKIVLIRTATPEFVSAHPEFVSLFHEVWPTHPGEPFRKSCRACISHDATAVLQRIESPTLVMVGDRDILVPPPISKRLSAGIKNARLKVIKGGGHVPWLDKPEDCVKALSAFLYNTSWGQCHSSERL